MRNEGDQKLFQNPPTLKLRRKKKRKKIVLLYSEKENVSAELSAVGAEEGFAACRWLGPTLRYARAISSHKRERAFCRNKHREIIAVSIVRCINTVANTDSQPLSGRPTLKIGGRTWFAYVSSLAVFLCEQDNKRRTWTSGVGATCRHCLAFLVGLRQP